ncbi:FAD-dependent monooxygenase [Actinoplanes bogorensis]|uniref:FAD-dependent monooxygenase n=1 Tax=Paractinoplanes bogorensis TaxID=1610840 RepID=A0ABS5YT80_9ACTN|nr:FAD-dependent monooxygenase [Actinoplanes bogorensis]MBU2666659.1 FAD-dependent monooxygenase [Actinoplanes bogorensis]
MADILVSGAGLGGPALAHLLARQGHSVTVVERAPAPREAGYKVDVRGAATTVLQRMGVYEQARAADVGMRQITYVNRHGKPFAALPADLLMGRRGDDIEVMRGDLSRVLHDAASASGAGFVFGDSIAALADGPEGVDVTFASGRSARFDLVVAADGLHSATRRLVFGEVPLVHLGASIAIFSTANTLGIDHEEVMYSEPGRLIFAYAMGPSEPMRVGLVLAGPGSGRDPRAIVDGFAGGGWRTAEFLSALEAADDLYVDSLSQVEVPRWSSGRVVLLGDAAHCPAPSSGQGTSLALVGAHVLADELASKSQDQALSAYEVRMRPYVEKNLAFGRRMVKDMVPGGRLAIAFRNYGMRTLKFHPRKEQVIDKVLAPLREAANAISV